MSTRTTNAGHAARYYRAKGHEKVADAALKVADVAEARAKGSGVEYVANKAANKAMRAERRAWDRWESKLDPKRK